MKPRELVSKIAKIIEKPPAPPAPSRFEREGGWNSPRPSAGGHHSHLSPDETASAKLAGAEALVQLQRQQDARPAPGPIHDQHIT